MRFPDAFLQEIKFRNDIEDVVSRYVTLKPAGANLVACCPFHSEKTPSFTVSKSKKIFHCFGCDAGGDAITFVMLIENTDYASAVAKLAEWAKIPVPEDDGEYKDRAIKQKRIFELNREAALYFHNNLTDQNNAESKNALEYIQKRGIKNPTIKHFGLGYASNSWSSLTKYLSDKGFSKEEQKTAFLCSMTKKGEYTDIFRGRLMFPIIDVNGNVIAFGGRIIINNGDERKYLNSSDTPAFKKSRNLYALNFAKNTVGTNKKHDYFIMCEGYMDVIAMHQAGFTNAVASLGTAVTGEQARLMSKYAKRVILAYDTDEAGKRAMQRAAALLGEVGIEVKVLNLGEAKDPDEFIQKYGKEKLENNLIKPKGYIDNKLDAIYGKYNLDDAEEKIKAINESCEELSLINSEVEREVYGGKLADKYKVSADSILKAIKKLASARLKKEKTDMINNNMRKIEGFGDRLNPDRVKFPESVKKEEIILGILMKYPEFYSDIKDILTENIFISEFNRKIYNLFKEVIESKETTGTEDNSSFDIVMITKDLSAEETGRITKMIISDNIPGKDIKNELVNFIGALEKQNKVYEKKNVNLKEISASGDDWISYIRAKDKDKIKVKKDEMLKREDN
ncbi:MAG: DNA primase [Oscillospiraceae bacterium]|nr:DNA primase [Oscillospiraceae bacterium]